MNDPEQDNNEPQKVIDPKALEEYGAQFEQQLKLKSELTKAIEKSEEEYAAYRRYREEHPDPYGQPHPKLKLRFHLILLDILSSFLRRRGAYLPIAIFALIAISALYILLRKFF